MDLRAKVYTASRLRHAQLWRDISQANAPWLQITSRWINEPHVLDPQGQEQDSARSPEQFARHWIDDEEDVRRADYVLCYAGMQESFGYDILHQKKTKDKTMVPEVLRGALVEAGIGIALNKRIVLCGASPSFGTWRFHPCVKAHLPTLEEALAWIRDDFAGLHAMQGVDNSP